MHLFTIPFPKLGPDRYIVEGTIGCWINSNFTTGNIFPITYLFQADFWLSYSRDFPPAIRVYETDCTLKKYTWYKVLNWNCNLIFLWSTQ